MHISQKKNVAEYERLGSVIVKFRDWKISFSEISTINSISTEAIVWFLIMKLI